MTSFRLDHLTDKVKVTTEIRYYADQGPEDRWNEELGCFVEPWTVFFSRIGYKARKRHFDETMEKVKIFNRLKKKIKEESAANIEGVFNSAKNGQWQEDESLTEDQMNRLLAVQEDIREHRDLAFRHLVDWSLEDEHRQPIPCNEETKARVLDFQEVREAVERAWNIYVNQNITEDERGNSSARRKSGHLQAVPSRKTKG